MEQPSSQAQRIRDSLNAQPEVTVILDASGSPSSRLRGRFVSQAPDTIRIQLTTAVGDGMVVSVAGEIETPAGREPFLGKYKVRSCRPAGIAKYHVDLSPVPAAQESAPKQEPATTDEDLDYYEVLQVSRNADSDTIRRVFHALAQRYHPDNKETGDDTKFRQVVEAHTVLIDPEKRAAHDVKLAQDDQTRHRIFDSLESTQGVAAEIRKRKGILRLLYAKRLSDPHAPAMRARDFTEMLGCPIEHLEFAIWYLRENRLIVRSDNNRFEITCAGVEAFEAEEASFGNKKPFLTLPAPGTLTETA